jgi:MFS family permease
MARSWPGVAHWQIPRLHCSACGGGRQALRPLGEHATMKIFEKSFPSKNDSSLFIVKFTVFLDMLAVGIFVPLLPYYWKELGIRSEMLGLVTSIYQLSQIVSGVILGWIGDHVIGRKAVLLLSFAGSAVSYLLAGIAYYYSKSEDSKSHGIMILIASRVTVGLVKQTMTISRAVITALSSDADRTRSLSHLRACGTLAFMIGPSIGGMLAKWFDKAVPAFVAAGLFTFIYLLAVFLVPQKQMDAVPEEESKVQKGAGTPDQNRGKLATPAMGMRQLLLAPGLGMLTVPLTTSCTPHCIRWSNALLYAPLHTTGAGPGAAGLARTIHERGRECTLAPRAFAPQGSGQAAGQ